MGSRTMFSPHHLDDHAVKGLARGLEQPGQKDLAKAANGQDQNDGQVIAPQGNDLRVLHLGREIQAGAKDPQEREDAVTHQPQKDGVAGRSIRHDKILLPQVPGEQGVDAHAGAGGHGDHQVLHGIRQRDRSQRGLADVRDKHTVYNVVQGLDEHGEHHGPRHGQQQPVDGHNTHFIFLGRLGLLVHFSVPPGKDSAACFRTSTAKSTP